MYWNLCTLAIVIGTTVSPSLGFRESPQYVYGDVDYLDIRDAFPFDSFEEYDLVARDTDKNCFVFGLEDDAFKIVYYNKKQAEEITVTHSISHFIDMQPVKIEKRMKDESGVKLDLKGAQGIFSITKQLERTEEITPKFSEELGTTQIYEHLRDFCTKPQEYTKRYNEPYVRIGGFFASKDYEDYKITEEDKNRAMNMAMDTPDAVVKVIKIPGITFSRTWRRTGLQPYVNQPKQGMASLGLEYRIAGGSLDPKKNPM